MFAIHAQVADRPGDWIPLAILADKLDEDGVAHPIRELLPEGVAGVSFR